MVDISIVLATQNRAQHLRKLLENLKIALCGVSSELIVIVGDCTDNTEEVLKEFNIPFEFERNLLGNGKHNWAELYNSGFAKSTGYWSMYASDDIVFNPYCFLYALEELRNVDDSIAGGIFFYKNLGDQLNFGIDYTYGRKMLLNYGLVRTDYFHKVHGLDTSYAFYCADGDLCFKLYEDGKDFIPLRKCLVTHKHIYDKNKQAHYAYANSDIAHYKEKWIKYANIDESLNPRRVEL